MKCRVKAIFCALHDNKLLKFSLDIWNAVRFVLKYSILRELRFITLPVFMSFDNQIAHFLEWARRLFYRVSSGKAKNREKSQSKTDQDFGRNRKTAKKGVIVYLYFYWFKTFYF